MQTADAFSSVMGSSRGSVITLRNLAQTLVDDNIGYGAALKPWLEQAYSHQRGELRQVVIDILSTNPAIEEAPAHLTNFIQTYFYGLASQEVEQWRNLLPSMLDFCGSTLHVDEMAPAFDVNNHAISPGSINERMMQSMLAEFSSRALDTEEVERRLDSVSGKHIIEINFQRCFVQMMARQASINPVQAVNTMLSSVEKKRVKTRYFIKNKGGLEGAASMLQGNTPMWSEFFHQSLFEWRDDGNMYCASLKKNDSPDELIANNHRRKIRTRQLAEKLNWEGTKLLLTSTRPRPAAN